MIIVISWVICFFNVIILDFIFLILVFNVCILLELFFLFIVFLGWVLVGCFLVNWKVNWIVVVNFFFLKGFFRKVK